MAAVWMDGKKIAAKVNLETAAECARLKEKYSIQPGLAVVLIGEDPASQIYVNSKAKKCEELGIFSAKYVLPKEATMVETLALIDELNQNENIHGILVQSPPPPQIDEEAVVAAIRPDKDVDCFHPENVGKMLIGKTDGFFPCTPYGVMVLLREYGIDPAGKHAVIVGRSNIVGKPLVALLLQKAPGANATVTCVHSGTKDIEKFTRDADILIAAVGKPEFITGSMVKEGAVVVDVGINRVPDATAAKGYRIVGDVNFAEVERRASFITPVPGGVGPMTIALLMANAVKGCKLQNHIA